MGEKSQLNQNPLSENRIPQNTEKSSGSTKYSISEDNKGRTLTKEQQEYFKERKVVEDTGSYGKGLTTANDYTPNPEVYETEVTDADKLIDAKIENYKVELESKLERKEETHNYYNQEIAHKQSILDKKKNKAAKVARDLTDQIERLKRNRDNADAEADKQINALKERIDKMGTKEYRTVEQRKVKQASIRKLISKLIGDTSTWKDKKIGLSYKLHPLKRNLRDVIGDTKKNDEIYQALQGRYNHN